MAKTVLLTGITGFIAKRIAYDLLEQGYRVKGTLRSPKREGEVSTALAGINLDNLSFVQLDLMSNDGWDAAMVGVDVLMHTASPFPLSDPADENDLIAPAKEGTLRALSAAARAGVDRVILTSSMVAMMHTDRPDGHKFGPDDWTDLNHPTSGAYVKSKTIAEKAAWDLAETHNLNLTTIHPGLVTGTPIDQHYGASLQVIERIMAGKDPMVPNIGLPVVDIADVSALHIAAMEQDHTIGKRIVATDSYWMLPQIAEMLADAFPDQPVKTRIAPKFMLKLMGLFDPTIKGIVPMVNRKIAIDNTSGRDLVGGFIGAKDAVIASAKAVLK